MGVTGARQPDGSLPTLDFMHLASGSDLIDTGVYVGIPYNGSAPDLGAFETLVPVPVNMLSFTGVLNNTGVTLSWKMATETNNKGWSVERRMVDRNTIVNWLNLGFINGALNSSLPTTYSFLDQHLSTGIYQYRLKQVDLDGHIFYSMIITIRNDAAQDILHLTAFPNPFTSATTINYTIPVKGHTMLNIYNTEGQLVSTLVNQQLEKGTYQFQLNGAKLPCGTYTIKLKAEDKIVSNTMVKMY